jgi:hypothetical protein
MSGWLENPLVVMGFMGLLCLIFALQDLLLVPPDRRDAVSGVLWGVAGISVICVGIARQYDHKTSALLLFILFLATGTGAVVWKTIGLVRLRR